MTLITDDTIAALTNECKELEVQFRAKQEELENAILNKLTSDGKKHPMSSFLGQVAIYDRPHKWTSPKTLIFNEDTLNTHEYLDFNGIFTGEEINSLYTEFDIPPYNPTEQFYTFAIPEEWSKIKKGHRIPINEVYELLIFKVA